MDQDRSDLLAPPKGAKDHIINTLKAGLSCWPFGGAIASLIDDYVGLLKNPLSMGI